MQQRFKLVVEFIIRQVLKLANIELFNVYESSAIKPKQYTAFENIEKRSNYSRSFTNMDNENRPF